MNQTESRLRRSLAESGGRPVLAEGEELEGVEKEDGSLGDYPLDGLLIRSETRTVHGVCRRI